MNQWHRIEEGVQETYPLDGDYILAYGMLYKYEYESDHQEMKHYYNTKMVMHDDPGVYQVCFEDGKFRLCDWGFTPPRKMFVMATYWMQEPRCPSDKDINETKICRECPMILTQENTHPECSDFCIWCWEDSVDN